MEKIKQSIESKLNSQAGKDIMVVFIVVLVGLSSFGLGRLSKEDINKGLKVEYTDQQANTINTLDSLNTLDSFENQNLNSQNISQVNTENTQKVPAIPNSVGKSFFASSRGQKYYSIGCSAGKTIKQENKVYFSTKTDAEKAGYELSSSCK
ncbi:MAG: hypothetical protein UU24_C0008G0010 [Candidatus Nomurabacteria bacterium GW2011_GWA2_40_9]|uniref:Ada DNA repair metal-binding domain-containing protein n=1 Tax=Candidatus Nomurabacteria bacterium GW2011_GWA2_40_9 TaxID=1618734 RepID=A0A0G0WVJ8_9BACT|nr:MAG: hypothetical protein UU24_C0008G0010 [Candidatus Nomurabacteria bacterium GW2011_GWA2_40_9]